MEIELAANVLETLGRDLVRSGKLRAEPGRTWRWDPDKTDGTAKEIVEDACEEINREVERSGDLLPEGVERRCIAKADDLRERIVEARRRQPTLLEVPAHARGAFEEVAPVLEEFFDDGSLVLGGGTGLAAYWRHRPSADLDFWAKQRHRDRVDWPGLAGALADRCPHLTIRQNVSLAEAMVGANGQLQPGTASIGETEFSLGSFKSSEYYGWDLGLDDYLTSAGGTKLCIQSVKGILEGKILRRMVRAAGTGRELAPRDVRDVYEAAVRDGETLAKIIARLAPGDARRMIEAVSGMKPGWSMGATGEKPLLPEEGGLPPEREMQEVVASGVREAQKQRGGQRRPGGTGR